MSDAADIIRFGVTPLVTFAMGAYAGRKSERLDRIRAARERRQKIADDRRGAVGRLLDATASMKHHSGPKNPKRGETRLAVLHARNAIDLLNDQALTDTATRFIAAERDGKPEADQLRAMLLELADVEAPDVS